MTVKNQKRLWIVFTGETDIAWLKILKPGFRHCYALYHDGQHWLTIDPLSSYTDLEILSDIAAECHLPFLLQQQGLTVVEAKIPTLVARAAPIAFYSCVEAIKRLIGLHRVTVITPWQLYQYLIKQKEMSHG